MRLIRWAVVSLMALAFAGIVVGVVAAAPLPARTLNAIDNAASITAIPLGEEITPTLPITKLNPVGLAISKFFSVPYTEVITLQQSGVGFGVIARAYLTAKASNGTLTPQQLLQLHQSGVGWGQIMMQYGITPGGKGLGAIMGKHAGNGNGGKPSCPGNSCKAPGKEHKP